MKTPHDKVWLDNDTYVVFFGEVETYPNGDYMLRESEYQLDNDLVVVTDSLYDEDGNFYEAWSIDPDSLKYRTTETELGEGAPITREEYDEIAAFTKQTALESIKD
jgi:hypothetical protein